MKAVGDHLAPFQVEHARQPWKWEGKLEVTLRLPSWREFWLSRLWCEVTVARFRAGDDPLFMHSPIFMHEKRSGKVGFLT